MGGPVPGPEQALVTAPIIINQKLKQNLIILRSYEISSIYRYDFHFTGVQFLGQQILSLDIMKSEIAGTVSILLSMHLPTPRSSRWMEVFKYNFQPPVQCWRRQSIFGPHAADRVSVGPRTAAQQRAAPGRVKTFSTFFVLENHQF